MILQCTTLQEEWIPQLDVQEEHAAECKWLGEERILACCLYPCWIRCINWSSWELFTEQIGEARRNLFTEVSQPFVSMEKAPRLLNVAESSEQCLLICVLHWAIFSYPPSWPPLLLIPPHFAFLATAFLKAALKLDSLISIFFLPHNTPCWGNCPVPWIGPVAGKEEQRPWPHWS